MENANSNDKLDDLGTDEQIKDTKKESQVKKQVRKSTSVVTPSSNAIRPDVN